MAQTDLLNVLRRPRHPEMARLVQGAVITVSVTLAGCAQTKAPQFCKGDYTARYEDSRDWVEYRSADQTLAGGRLRPATADDRQDPVGDLGGYTDDGYFIIWDIGLIVPRDISTRESWKKDRFNCVRSGAENSFNVTCRSQNGSITTTYSFDPAVGITSAKVSCSGCANRAVKLVSRQGMGALCSDDISRPAIT
jgi:hypothetical protein